MKQAVVLYCRSGKLQDLVNEKWRNRATAPSLGFQRTHTRNRHIVGKIQRTKPVYIAIENSGTKAGGPELSAVSVDALGAPQEQLAIAEEMTIMIQIMDVNLKISLTYVIEERMWNRVFAFGYNFETGFDPVGIVHVHKA